MAVVLAATIRPEHDGMISMEGAEFQQHYDVFTDEAMGPGELLRAFFAFTGISSSSTYFGATCHEVSCKMHHDTIYTVDVKYKSMTQEEKEKMDTPPLQRATVILQEAREIEVIRTIDKDGKAIVNSAGSLYNPPLSRRAFKAILILKKNLPAQLDQTLWLAKTNASPFTCSNSTATITVDTKQGFLVNLKQDPQTWNFDGTNYDYIESTWEFEIDPIDQNKIKVVDQGYYVKPVPPETEPVLAQDGNNVDTTEPVNLDGSGHKLPFGADPVFKTYEDYYTAEFNSIGF